MNFLKHVFARIYSVTPCQYFTFYDNEITDNIAQTKQIPPQSALSVYFGGK